MKWWNLRAKGNECTKTAFYAQKIHIKKHTVSSARVHEQVVAGLQLARLIRSVHRLAVGVVEILRLPERFRKRWRPG